jgi:hypothetical protein
VWDDAESDLSHPSGAYDNRLKKGKVKKVSRQCGRKRAHWRALNGFPPTD